MIQHVIYASGTHYPAAFAALAETFGVYEAVGNHHDRVLYVADFERGENRRFGVPVGEVSISPSHGT